jgi:hypothetical protein
MAQLQALRARCMVELILARLHYFTVPKLAYLCLSFVESYLIMAGITSDFLCVWFGENVAWHTSSKSTATRS